MRARFWNGLRQRGPLSGLLYLILVLTLTGAAVSQDVTGAPDFTPVPAWVERIELELPGEALPAGISNGQHYLLLDSQDRLNGDTTDRYRHRAWLITDRSGLEDGSRLSYDFDPANEDLQIHTLRVWRDGVVQDRLDRGMFTTIRRETGLQSGMVDGRLTSFAELADIRVGDIVESEISIHARSQTWPGGYGKTTRLEWAVPIVHQHYRILSRAGSPLTIRLADNAPQPVLTTEAGWEAREWDLTDTPPVISEALLPAGYIQRAFVSVSNLESWADVVEWALPIYETGAELPEAGLARIAQIRTENGGDRERITAATRFVQDEIRYVADGIGAGGYVPHTPSRILELGYGDCKDKSVLLVAMLRALGFEAYVALTDIDEGPGLSQLAPSPNAFDHMIVQVRFEGESYWVDATAYHEGGLFPDLAPLPYGHALPIRDGQSGLADIVALPARLPTMALAETYDMLNVGTEGVVLTAITHYRGSEANVMRVGLASRSADYYSRTFLTYYRNRYPGIETRGELTIEDDRDANLITTVESYLLSPEAFHADELSGTFPMRADAVLGQISLIDETERLHPIALPFPRHRAHRLAIVNHDWPLYGIPDVTLDEAFARFTTRSEERFHEISITETLQILSDQATAASAADYNAMIDEIESDANLTIGLNSSGAEPNAILDWIDDPQNERALGALIVVAVYLVMIPGAFLALRADKKMPSGARFYPVSVTKFVLMSALTANLYPMLWMWRNWRYVKTSQERDMSPFGRSLFGAFFFIGLYNEVAKEQDGRGLPRFLGQALAFGYLIWKIGSRLADTVAGRMADLAAVWLSVTALLALVSFVWLIPTVIAINGLNRDRPEIQRFNSRYTLGSAIAMLTGGIVLGLIVLGAFA